MNLLLLIIIVLAGLFCVAFLILFLPGYGSITGLTAAFDVVEKLFAIVAILIGGLWTYWLFIKNRQRYPRAEVVNNVSLWPASGKTIILRLNLVVRNLGSVLVQIEEIGVVISQLLPIPKSVASQLRKGGDPISPGKTEYDWDEIASRTVTYKYHENEIEPGETQAYQFDFQLTSDIKKVEVYSYVNNISKQAKQLAWDCSTIIDIK